MSTGHKDSSCCLSCWEITLRIHRSVETNLLNSLHTSRYAAQQKHRHSRNMSPYVQWSTCLSFIYHLLHMSSGVGVRLKVGDKNWEEWRGGVWGGAVPSSVGGLGACPQKKNQFCAKNYAILSKFWYLFPILQHKNFQNAKIVTSASEKVGGGLSPFLKVGDLSPCPPLLRRLWLVSGRTSCL